MSLLSIFPELSDDEVDEVICAVRDFFAERRGFVFGSHFDVELSSDAECLMLPELVKNFDDVYIMDGNSTDGTPEFARSMGCAWRSNLTMIFQIRASRFYRYAFSALGEGDA